MRALSVPSHVHCGEAPQGGAALLNARTGQWHVMNRTARELWEECRRTGDFDAAVASVSSRVPDAHAHRLRRDADVLAVVLLDRGLLVRRRPGAAARRLIASEPAPVECEPPYGRVPRCERGPSVERVPPAGPVDDPVPARSRLRRRDRAAGLIGLALAVCLLRLPFRVTLRTVTVVKRFLGRRDATEAQAERAVRAVRHAARHYPGRVACLELSLGALMALAPAARGLDWCLGSTGDALRFHAWVEVGRTPVPQPGDSDGEESLRGIIFRGILRV
ncbi:lasso peptide biosynthesis B2 protein [Streptomyces sp. NPDC050355]|uniref:lasso peptide biosynthesis B2 protein n=1 Tax=Streptomyces sp. NPDC050355 TaxID=3365609 RepID=UPI00379696F1